MIKRLREEFTRLWRAMRELDFQTATVLVLSTVLVIAQYKYGTREYFREEMSAILSIDAGGLNPFIYHCLTQAVTGLVVPAAVLLFWFRRRPSEIGLGLGDWKLAGLLMALYLPLVTVACWYLSSMPEFQNRHPQVSMAALSWKVFAVYHVVYLLNWAGWEYLFRGFTLFGTAHTFGHWAIFVQMIPFAVLHYTKPGPEAFLSVAGGLVLGVVVWRCRSFWVAVPIHWYQTMAMDFFCTLRRRADASGGACPEDLAQVARSLFG